MSQPSIAHYAAHPDAPAPHGHLFASVCWLLARHPAVIRLAARVPGAVDTDGDVLPWELAKAFTALDAHRQAWKTYEDRHPAPPSYRDEDGTLYDAWADAGPQPTPEAAAIGVMSRTEVTRLRLLALFTDTDPTAFAIGMLDGFDEAGHDLIRDWLTAITAYLGNPFGGPR